MNLVQKCSTLRCRVGLSEKTFTGWRRGFGINSPNPVTEFESADAIFEAALAHEQSVTAQINEIFRIAREESIWHVEVAFQWFITEQVEEEVQARDNLAKIRMVGTNPASLLDFDRHLSA